MLPILTCFILNSRQIKIKVFCSYFRSELNSELQCEALRAAAIAPKGLGSPLARGFSLGRGGAKNPLFENDFSLGDLH